MDMKCTEYIFLIVIWIIFIGQLCNSNEGIKFKLQCSDRQFIIQIQIYKMNSKYKERAIPLISVDQVSGKYTLTAEASEFIKSVPAPIGVVSVAGLYRTGKSYLLNQMLLNRSNGFGVGPTINPCTKGLWCWGTPVKGESADGQKLNIIVVDTEGIGALDVDQTHDTRIFTLAILASSCFIYNSVGSIDETALQNLSLVVNLTKHIQVRTQKSFQDEDPDKISNYFPSFFWVVRDFSLQMLDSEGNKMNSKEYLERALAPQKGFSQDIEEKNRIRKMLTSFFKERQCFTLVRPLIDEDKLQSLDKMNFDDLRPEFVSQVINFRKRVTGKLKPKMMNGQKLSGELYLSMLNSYVGAINDGAVPNIQNAWNYMCQEQCTKVMSESLQVFETELRQIKIPCSADEMNRGIEAAEEAAYEKFKKRSIGEQAEKYLKQLQSKMRSRTQQLKKINTQQGKAAFKKYITPSITTIQQKISKDQYGNFEEFLDDLKKLEEKVTKQGPNYVDSNLNCQICINKILGQGVTYLFKRMKNQKEQIRKTLEERLKLNQNEVENLKKQGEFSRASTKQKLETLDREKVDLINKLQRLELQLQKTAKDRMSEGEELSRNLSAKKAQIENFRKQFDLKINEANNRVEEMNKNLHEERSNWDKEKAIYQLKVRQQSEKIEQYEKKLQNSSARMALQTNELSQRYKDQMTKLQDQVQQLMRNLSQYRERNEDINTKYETLYKENSILFEKFESTERKLKQQTSSKFRQMQKMKNDHESELNRVRNQYMQTKDDSQKVGREMEDKIRRHQMKTKQVSEELKSVKSKYDRENQVLTQELQFTKRSLEDMKLKLSEQKNIYESRLAAAEQDSGLQRQEQVKRKISELKSAHQEQLLNLENQYRETQRNQSNQIESLSRLRNELELKLKVAEEQLSNQRAENDEIKDDLTHKYEMLSNEMKSQQREKVSELLAKEGLFNEKIASLERQLQQTRQNYYLKKTEMEETSKSQIIQIKNYYEMQREKQQTRHNEEKDKQKKKYSQTVEEYERRLQQESENHQEEVQRIESEYSNEVNALSITCNSLTHEKDTLSREKSVLEQKLQVLTELHNKMEFELNDKLQKLLQSSRTEKESLMRRVQQLQQNKNSMEKELLSLTHERDQYRSQTMKLSTQIEEYKLQYTTINDKYQSTKRSLDQKLKDLQAAYMKDKGKFQTDIALLQQNNAFAERNIVELNNDLVNTKARSEQQLRTLKEKYEEQIVNLNNKVINDKRGYEEKIERIKKQSSETETNLNKILSELSKQKAMCDQKIEYLERRVLQIQSKRASEVESLAEQLKSLREKFTGDNAKLKARAQQFQALLSNKIAEFSLLKNDYEIKFALAENRYTHLQSTSSNTIAQKIQMIKNLEKQLNDSRRRNQNEKSSQQMTHQQILSRMESKYRNEITSLSQQVTRRTQEIQYLNKQHERTIKDLSERLAVERQTRSSLQSKLARLETDYIQKQNKLTSEVDKLRSEKEATGLQIQRILARQREISKIKIAELENKMNETDKLKQKALYDKEKEEAKWKMQQNKFEEKLEQLREAVEKEKNDSRRLLKENQKLKAERKKNTSFIKTNQTTIMTRQISAENKENSQLQ